MMYIHEQISSDARAAQVLAERGGSIPYEQFPELKTFIDAATDAIYASLPATFDYHGKSYRLVTDIHRARVAIFESLAAEKSMLVTLICEPR